MIWSQKHRDRAKVALAFFVAVIVLGSMYVASQDADNWHERFMSIDRALPLLAPLLVLAVAFLSLASVFTGRSSQRYDPGRFDMILFWSSIIAGTIGWFWLFARAIPFVWRFLGVD